MNDQYKLDLVVHECLCYLQKLCYLQNYKVNSNFNHCLFGELTSASVRVRHTRAAAYPLEFEVSRCRMSQISTCFLPSLAQSRVWNNLPYTQCLTPER